MIDRWLEYPEPAYPPICGGKVLVVDDEPRVCDSLTTLLGMRGYDPAGCTSGRQAIALLSQESFDAILLDLNMPEVDGKAVMDYLIAAGIRIPVIVVSGDTSINAAIQALRNGVYDFIRKPYEPEELLKVVENAVYKTKLERANQAICARLEHSRNLYRYLIDSSPDFIYTLDPEGRFNFVNDRAESLLGYRKEELLGQHYTFLIFEEDLDRAKYVFNERRTDNRTNTNVELRLKCKSAEHGFHYFDTSFITIVLRSHGMYNIDDDVIPFLGTYGVARDISDRKKIEEAIKHQAYHDALTDLPNRALFKDRLGLAIAQAEREQEYLAVMFVDLDRFKWVNDTLGHHHGDELLKMVAGRLKQCLRKGDTLARFGGDEFTMLLPKVKNREDVQLAVNKIMERFGQPFMLEGNEVFVSASMGIALFPEHGNNIDMLMKCADIAMYHVKWEGKNRARFYSPEMNAIFHRRLAMENDLRRALERPEQFLLNYQPQVDVNLRRIVGMEVLVRWPHPERGLVSPSEFIQLAEETGMITQLTELVFERSCQQFAGWRKLGHDDVRMAINFSPKDIERADFVCLIRNGLEKYRLPKNILEVEITESAVMGDIETTVSQLKQLSSLGVQISIDDFGTRYASLGYLKKLPLHTIKIDKSFVQDIQSGTADIPIVSAIAAIAQGFRKELIAEGVETLEQMRVLRKMGCTVMQGFLFSQPLSAEDATRLLANPQFLWGRLTAPEQAALLG